MVPPGAVRYGAFVEKGAVIMPAFVNIGAWVGSGTMVDTWATVGSCAQVGRDVHLSGGVGLGGVLEPPAASPVIVEDGCFIGSRCGTIIFAFSAFLQIDFQTFGPAAVLFWIVKGGLRCGG